MRRLLDEVGCSLDDLLCDPELANKLDSIASSFAPGFSPLQYRWAARTIRKRAHERRESSRGLCPDLAQRKFDLFSPIEQLDLGKTQAQEWVYWLRDTANHPLYVGGTFDL